MPGWPQVPAGGQDQDRSGSQTRGGEGDLPAGHGGQYPADQARQEHAEGGEQQASPPTAGRRLAGEATRLRAFGAVDPQLLEQHRRQVRQPLGAGQLCLCRGELALLAGTGALEELHG